MKQIIFFFVFVSSLVLMAEPQGQYGVLVDKVAAHVNKDIILFSEIHQKKKELEKKKFRLPQEEKALNSHAAIMEILINEKLLEQAIVEQGLEATSEEVDEAFKNNLHMFKMTELQFVEAIQQEGHTIDTFKVQLKNQLGMRKLLGAQISKIKITDKDIVNFYQTNPQFFHRKGYHVRQIFFASPDKLDVAHQVHRLLKNGGRFEDAAKQYSEGPETEEGGDLGVLELGNMIPEFEQQISRLKPGEVSPVFQTKSGIHIIKLESIKPLGTSLNDGLKKQIHERLFQSKIIVIQQSVIQKSRETSFIKIL